MRTRETVLMETLAFFATSAMEMGMKGIPTASEKVCFDSVFIREYRLSA